MNTKIRQSARVRTPPKFSSGMTSSPSLACHRKFGPENNPLAVGRHPVPWLEVSCPKLQNEKQCVTRKNLGKKVWKLQQHSTQLANHKVLVIFSTKRKLHFWQGWKPKSWNFYRATTTIYALPKIGPNWFIAKYRLALWKQILCEFQTLFKANKRILRGMNWNGKWYLQFHERIPHSVVERNTPLLTRNLPFSTIDR